MTVAKTLGEVNSLVERFRHGLEPGGASFYSLLAVALVGLLGWIQVVPNGLLVAVLLGVVLYEFQKQIDQGLPLMQVAALLAVMQWTLGPALAFETTGILARYSMYVGKAEYFSFALPATSAFVIGLLAVGFSVKQREMLWQVDRREFLAIGLVLLVIASAADILGSSVSGGFGFLMHLLSQLRYVAVLYFLFSGHRLRWFLIVPTLLPLLRNSSESAMFHDLLLWSGLLFCYWHGMSRKTTAVKWAILLSAAVFAFTVQAIKQEYRIKRWSGQQVSLIGTIGNFWFGEEKVFSEGVIANVVVRLNQGWIISAVMRHVPAAVPFANGQTIYDAVKGSLLPRFLNPNKAKAGGQVNFRKYTGLDIADSTSMAISPLGEAYVNYGRTGGIVLMLFYGIAFSIGFALCLRWTVHHPDFLFWLPLIFYQAIKAETEFSTILNQLTKGAIVAFGFYWVLHSTQVIRFLGGGERRTKAMGRRRPKIRPGRGPTRAVPGAAGDPGGRKSS